MLSIGAVILLFIVGFVAPRYAKPLERKIRARLKPLERKAAKPKIVGPVLELPVKGARKSAEKSLKAGKKARDKTPF